MRATATGVVTNLFRFMSPEQLQDWGIQRINLAGNASRNYFIDEIMRQCGKTFQISAESRGSCSAAYGAALHALQFSRSE